MLQCGKPADSAVPDLTEMSLTEVARFLLGRGLAAYFPPRSGADVACKFSQTKYARAKMTKLYRLPGIGER